MMVQLSIERGDPLWSARVPEGLQYLKVSGAEPRYGMWGGNKLLLQEKSWSAGNIFDVYVSAPESNQLIAKYQKEVLLFHLSLEGSIEYDVEGLGTILLHERAFTFYYVPFWLAHVVAGLSSNRSIFICMDPEYLRSFSLRFPHIKHLLQKINTCHAVAVSDSPFIADYNMLSRVYHLQQSTDPRTTINMVYDLLDVALNRILHNSPPKPLKVSRLEMEKFYDIRKLITSNLQHEYTRKELSALAGLTYYEVRVLFPQLFGISVKNMLLEARMMQAEKQIMTGDKIPVIAKSLGYSGESGLRRAFTQFFGLTPNEYRQGGRKNIENVGFQACRKSG